MALPEQRLARVSRSAGVLSLDAAALAAPYVTEGLDRWNPDLPSRWEMRYRRFFRKRTRVCLFVSALLNYRPSARAAVALLGRAPWLASPWLRRISTPDEEIRSLAAGLRPA